MPNGDKQLYEIGPFRLDAHKRLLERDGERVPIPQKQVDVLLFLVAHRGELLEKETLLAEFWGPRADPSNLTMCIAKLREALSDGRNGKAFIETIPTRGYRFCAAGLAAGCSSVAIFVRSVQGRPVLRWQVTAFASANDVYKIPFQMNEKYYRDHDWS